MKVSSLGCPLRTVITPDASFGKGPDGRDWMYVVCTGDPAVLSIIDVRTGRRVQAFELADAEASWGSVVDRRGHLYIGTHGKVLLYRYVPGDQKPEKLGALPGETHHWRLAADELGNIYGGTYPGGKVFKYDPERGEFTDYGRMADGENYVRSVACGRGKVYAGTGSAKAQLFEIDPDGGAKRGIPLPERFRNHKEIYDLSVAGDLLFARLTYHVSTSPLHNVTLVYDLRSEKWIDEWPNTPGWDVSPPDDNNCVYFKQGDRLMKYDLTARRLMDTGLNISAVEATRGFCWIDVEDPDFPGRSLVSANMRCRYFIYNPATGHCRWMKGEALGPPAILRSMAIGPDGRLYIGAYGSAGVMARYDADGNAFESLRGMPQIEGMAAVRGKLYMGAYPNAGLYEYDPARPWSFGENPRKLPFNARDHEQDRPFVIIPAGDQLAVGTVPAAGRLGGALCLYDPETSATDVFRDIVPEQSVLALEYMDGLIYGGTTVWGGYGIAAKAEEAKLFIWDVRTRRKVWEGPPIAGEKAVSALRFDANGLLWGIAGGSLFAFDPQSRRTVRSVPLYDFAYGNIYLKPNVLRFHRDGYLYGTAAGAIFRFDPRTWEHETLVPQASLFAMDDAGHIFFVRDRKEVCLFLADPDSYRRKMSRGDYNDINRSEGAW
jgi:hypothetical protein